MLFRVSTTGSVARKLAFLLVFEGLVLVTAGYPDFAFDIPFSIYDSHPMLNFFAGLLHHGSDVVMIALYPPFLALALNTSLTRPFAGKRARIGLAIGSAVLGLVVVITDSPVATTLLYFVVMLLFVYALVASIHAWRTAKRGINRQRAGIFALGFGVRDLGWGLTYAIGAWVMWTQADPFAMPDIA